MIVTEKFRGLQNIVRRGVCSNVVVDPSLVTPINHHHTFRVKPVTFSMSEKGIVVSPAQTGAFILTDQFGVDSEETVITGATVVTKDGICGIIAEVSAGGVYFKDGDDVYYLSAEGVCTYVPEVMVSKCGKHDRNERILSADSRMKWVTMEHLLGTVSCSFNNKYKIAYKAPNVRNIGEGLDNVVFEIITKYTKDKIGTAWSLSTYFLNAYVDLALGKVRFAIKPKKVEQGVLNYQRSTSPYSEYDDDLFNPIVNPEVSVNAYFEDDAF